MSKPSKLNATNQFTLSKFVFNVLKLSAKYSAKEVKYSKIHKLFVFGKIYILYFNKSKLWNQIFQKNV